MSIKSKKADAADDRKRKSLLGAKTEFKPSHIESIELGSATPGRPTAASNT